MKFSALDVLNRWTTKSKAISKITNDKKNDLLDQIVLYCKSNEITLQQATYASEFAKSCSDEMLVNFMNGIMETGNIPNIRMIHKFIASKVVEIVNLAQRQK